MGMTKLKKYQVEEDNNSSLSIEELIDNDHEVDKDEAEENKKDKNEEIIETEQQASTKELPIPRWQRNLQTFYNLSRRENDEDNNNSSTNNKTSESNTSKAKAVQTPYIEIKEVAEINTKL